MGATGECPRATYDRNSEFRWYPNSRTLQRLPRRQWPAVFLQHERRSCQRPHYDVSLCHLFWRLELRARVGELYNIRSWLSREFVLPPDGNNPTGGCSTKLPASIQT